MSGGWEGREWRERCEFFIDLRAMMICIVGRLIDFQFQSVALLLFFFWFSFFASMGRGEEGKSERESYEGNGMNDCLMTVSETCERQIF